MRRPGILAYMVVALCALVFWGGANPAGGATGPAGAEAMTARVALARLPLYFTENAGQWDSRVRFKARTAGGELFVADDHVALTVPEDRQSARVLFLRPLGGRAEARPRAGGLTGAKMHFHLGNDPAKWRTDVAAYDSVVYDAVYPGIDLRYHGDNRLLEYDFVVAPGADPGRIRLRLDGAAAVRLDSDGAMVVTLPGGRELRQAAPVVYQERDGVREPVAGAFVLEKAGDAPVFGFRLAAYDTSRTLVIDPTLTYSTLLGGSLNDYASAVTTTGTGAAALAVVAGTTYSGDFPQTPAKTVTKGDLFISGLSLAGDTLAFSNTIGGKDLDEARGVAVNGTGIYVTGYTKSTDFPTSTALWPALSGTKEDAFILAVDTATGKTLQFSTFFGGTGSDFGNAIALDSSGNVYVAGTTASTDMPVKNALYTANSGGKDGFLLKLNVTGSVLAYATYFGGEKDDEISALAISSAGDAIVAGSTLSAKLPVKNAYQAKIGSTTGDGFFARINPTCTELVYCSYLGGSGVDEVNALALDGSGNLILTGATKSTNFPVKNALVSTLAGGTDAFLTLVDVTGRFLRFSTYFGGAGEDVGTAVAVDQGSDGGLSYIYVGGSTTSANLPAYNAWSAATAASVTQNGYGYRGAGDGFVAKFEPHGARLVNASYLGGPGLDAVTALATPASGTRIVFVAGQSTPASTTGDPATTRFPTTAGVLSPDPVGLADAFVAKVTEASLYPTDTPSLSLNFPSAAPIAGTTVAVTLTYANSGTPSNISAFSTTIGYDPNVLEVTAAEKSAAAAYSAYSRQWQDDGNGKLRFMMYISGAAPAALTAGPVATVTFRVKYTDGSTVTQVTNAPSATNTSGVDTPINGFPGVVELTQRCGQLGDCDCSGTVQLWEVQQSIVAALAGSSNMCFASNYTSITAADLQLIVNNHLFRSAANAAIAAGLCPAAGEATATLRPGPAQSVAGALAVPLTLVGGGATISTMIAEVAYDAARFSDATVSAGPSATAVGKSVSGSIVAPGKLRIVVFSLADRRTLGDGEVARVTLVPAAGATGPRGKLTVTATAATPDAVDVPVTSASCSLQNGLGPALQLLLPQ